MKEANQLTDLTLVIYPSNHVLVPSPKIMLLGKGKEWKDDIVTETNNYWTETPVLFYFVEEEKYDSDILSWLYLNITNSDFIIGKLSSDVDDISLITPFLKDKNTFLLYNNLDLDLQNWFEVLNPNKDLSTNLSIVLKIKEMWVKNSKYI